MSREERVDIACYMTQMIEESIGVKDIMVYIFNKDDPSPSRHVMEMGDIVIHGRQVLKNRYGVVNPARENFEIPDSSGNRKSFIMNWPGFRNKWLTAHRKRGDYESELIIAPEI